jgi:hypothetical protein
MVMQRLGLSPPKGLCLNPSNIFNRLQGTHSFLAGLEEFSKGNSILNGRMG